MSDKNFVLISGFNIHDNNRGTAALSYGAISFLKERKLLDKNHVLVNFRVIKNFIKRCNRGHIVRTIATGDGEWKHLTYNVFFIEIILFKYFGILFPFTIFGKVLRHVSLVAAINGGDGFSDIYGTKTFRYRLHDIYYAIRANIPVIILPQTLGPFYDEKNLMIAESILKYAKRIYVRDDKFVDELKKMNVNYEITKDLSAYMKPQPWNIKIPNNAVGINVSGLAYCNSFRTLTGQFEQYPQLINEIIKYFQKKKKTVYLIPHSYCYNKPEVSNDDMVACQKAYDKLENKNGVVFVDMDLTSPQVKYLISQMSFFIGTRMHANFAAIYTGVPVFGLAYSYKFEGAFTTNGLDGTNQTVMINNLCAEDIPNVINRIDKVYQEIANDNNQ